jgi:enoyl-CoA hydratase/carnithine racemase
MRKTRRRIAPARTDLAQSSTGAQKKTAQRRTGEGSNSHPGEIEITPVHGSLVATLKGSNRHNRLSAEMARRLIDLAETVEDDESVTAFVIIGDGPAFCAGFDADADPAVVETLASVSKPTIALINGEALDEGLELAMALDIRVAVRKSRLALTQLTRGQLPCFGGTQRLPRLIGAAQALRMILTGDAIDGEEALRLGLATYLARDYPDLRRLGSELLRTLAEKGPLALRLVKDAVRNGYDMTVEQGIRLEEDLYALLQTTADRSEGVRAFMEKRKPLFKGA